MHMSVGRRLAEAVGSWLHLEFCCYRAGLLSEGALKAAVGQMLSSFPILVPGVRAYSDFAHDALNPIKRRGRKKEVDFALALAGKGLPKTNAEILIEAKWANSTHCTPENVFTDFLRLAALKKADPGATCIFLLAGHTSAMSKITGAMPFNCGGIRNKGIGRSGNPKRVTPTPSNTQHQQHWASAIKGMLQDSLTIPESFVTQACSAHPIQSDGGTVDFQAQCWEIVEVSGANINPADWS